ncbi:unnamed protein product, partial [Mesorhabditis spiculigera]
MTATSPIDALHNANIRWDDLQLIPTEERAAIQPFISRLAFEESWTNRERTTIKINTSKFFSLLYNRSLEEPLHVLGALLQPGWFLEMSLMCEGEGSTLSSRLLDWCEATRLPASITFNEATLHGRTIQRALQTEVDLTFHGCTYWAQEESVDVQRPTSFKSITVRGCNADFVKFLVQCCGSEETLPAQRPLNIDCEICEEDTCEWRDILTQMATLHSVTPNVSLNCDPTTTLKVIEGLKTKGLIDDQHYSTLRCAVDEVCPIANVQDSDRHVFLPNILLTLKFSGSLNEIELIPPEYLPTAVPLDFDFGDDGSENFSTDASDSEDQKDFVSNGKD